MFDTLRSAGERLALVARAEEMRQWEREGHRSFEDWLAAKEGTGPGRARRRARTARKVRKHRKTAKALEDGDISEDEADVVADAADENPGAEDDLLDTAKNPNQSHRDLEDRAAKAKASAEDDAARARRLRNGRRAGWGIDRDGFWTLTGRFQPEVGAAIKAHLQAQVDRILRHNRKAGRREPVDRYRADAVAAAVCGRDPETVPHPVPQPDDRAANNGPGRTGRPGPTTEDDQDHGPSDRRSGNGTRGHGRGRGRTRSVDTRPSHRPDDGDPDATSQTHSTNDPDAAQDIDAGDHGLDTRLPGTGQHDPTNPSAAPHPISTRPGRAPIQPNPNDPPDRPPRSWSWSSTWPPSDGAAPDPVRPVRYAASDLSPSRSPAPGSTTPSSRPSSATGSTPDGSTTSAATSPPTCAPPSTWPNRPAPYPGATTPASSTTTSTSTPTVAPAAGPTSPAPVSPATTSSPTAAIDWRARPATDAGSTPTA